MGEPFEIKNGGTPEVMNQGLQNGGSETPEYNSEQSTRIRDENDEIMRQLIDDADFWLKDQLQKLGEQDGGNVDGANMLPDLTQKEKQDLNKLAEQSKKPNTIDYLNNQTYIKCLNNIEYDFGLPRHSLECVCYAESQGHLYNGNHVLGSRAGAQGLFQLMPDTQNQYMNNKEVVRYCGKHFKSRTEFIKNPLATAVAAAVIIKRHMEKYNFQTALACYNWGSGNYEKKVGTRNLEAGDFSRLPEQTRNYVPVITRAVISGDYKDAKLKKDPETKKREEIDEQLFADVLVDLGEHSRYRA